MDNEKIWKRCNEKIWKRCNVWRTSSCLCYKKKMFTCKNFFNCH